MPRPPAHKPRRRLSRRELCDRLFIARVMLSVYDLEMTRLKQQIRKLKPRA